MKKFKTVVAVMLVIAATAMATNAVASGASASALYKVAPTVWKGCC